VSIHLEAGEIMPGSRGRARRTGWKPVPPCRMTADGGGSAEMRQLPGDCLSPFSIGFIQPPAKRPERSFYFQVLEFDSEA